MFTDKQIQQIKKYGITQEQVNKQINTFVSGTNYIKIKNPADVNNGILKFDKNKIDIFINKYDNFTQNKINILKFVPASGAASRMFKDLFTFYKDKNHKIPKEKKHKVAFDFFKNINKFAFYDELNLLINNNISKSIQECIDDNNYKIILEYLLTEKGLNYGNTPKALIYFHKYKTENRTAFEEHIAEGIMYAKSGKNINIHFTVSPKHKDNIQKIEKELFKKYKSKIVLNTEYSYQEKNTDTIAVDLNNKPFVLDNGELLFRPAGHGALIKNLNNLHTDLIFIKNIDNVVVDNYKTDTVIYKKLLAGYLLQVQEQIFDYLNKIDKQDFNLSDLEIFVKEKLQIKFPQNYNELDNTEKLNFIRKKLNRPLRVCGMVKNQGEPGGGPFWVKHFDGSYQLQIVEKSQINLDDKNQKYIMQMSKYFNPVDLIISTKNYKGGYFDLDKFIDHKTSFISKKSLNGRDLKALELPGLWNGAMSDWNTIFVEVPLTTFNPVKIINDLLRKSHLNF